MKATVQNTGRPAIRDLLLAAENRLAAAGCTEARFEARYLLQAVLHKTKTELFLHADAIVSPVDVSRFQSMLNRRLQQEPLQYIVGRVEFWSRDFQVTPDVLIPRQETEFVLEKILALVQEQALTVNTILDMGTGSGVIADVLASQLGCQVVAVDCSIAALAVARANIRMHDLHENVTFVCSDLFAAIPEQEQFDLIVSNPPYVGESEKEDLQPQVIAYEPASALFAGPEGLACYQRLIPESIGYLKAGGWLCLEIGAGQGKAINNMLQESGFENIAVLKDYADHPRLALGKKPTAYHQN